jgi:hypothetical protein
MDINLGPGMFSWQLKKLQTLNNAPQWTNEDKQVPTIFGQINIYSIYNHPQCGASWHHGSSSQTGQVFLESIDHNWFFAKTT